MFPVKSQLWLSLMLSVPYFSDHRQRTPIVVVPAAATSVITLWNVREFLEDYKSVIVFLALLLSDNLMCV